MRRLLLCLFATALTMLGSSAPAIAGDSWTQTGGTTNQVNTVWFAPVILSDGRIVAIDTSRHAEVYDRQAGTWSLSADPMPSGRYMATTVALDDHRVLVVGGYDASGTTSTDVVEIYDADADSWTTAASLPVPLSGPALTLLPDGKVLAAGGASSLPPAATAYATTVHLYDPSDDSWALAAPLAAPRAHGNAMKMLDGRILVWGGSIHAGQPASSEIYSPGDDVWTSTGAGPLQSDGLDARALLADGRVLVVPHTEKTPVVYDPAVGTWTDTGDLPVFVVHQSHGSLVSFPDGTAVLFDATNKETAQSSYTNDSFVFSPVTNGWTRVAAGSGPPWTTYSWVGAFRLDQRRTLVIGGTDNPANSSWIYHSATIPQCTVTPVAADLDRIVRSTFACSDADGDSLSYQLHAPAAHGTATWGESLAYVPDLAFTGTETITIDVRDDENIVEVDVEVDASFVPAPFSLVSPAPGARLATTTPSFSWAASSDSGSGLVDYVLVIDGSPARTVGPGTTTAALLTPLGDGLHSWSVRTRDQAGHVRSTPERAFTVDATPPTAVLAGPAMALTSVPVTVNASASSDEAGSIDSWEWDLDGNGTYEVGPTGTASKQVTFDTVGRHLVRVRVADELGHLDTQSIQIDVRLNPPPGPLGVTVNRAAIYTNDPRVTISAIWPEYARSMVVSNDGGFAAARTFAVGAAIPWTLSSSGPERLPKTIYVRFVGGSAGLETYQDDIILDETAPVEEPAIVSSVDVRSLDRMFVPGPADLRVLGRRRLTIAIRGRDSNSGVASFQITTATSRPGSWRRYVARTVTTVKPGTYVYLRVRDRAGNRSAWRRVRAPW